MLVQNRSFSPLKFALLFLAIVAIDQSTAAQSKLNPFSGRGQFPRGLSPEYYQDVIGRTLQELNPKVDPQNEGYQRTVLAIAKAVRESRGFLREDTANREIEKFNQYQEVVVLISARNFPAAFERTLLSHYREQIFDLGMKDLTPVRQTIAAIPGELRFHDLEPGARLSTAIDQLIPEFSRLSASERKRKLDVLARFNPGIIACGSLREGDAELRAVFGNQADKLKVIAKGIGYYYECAPGSTVAVPTGKSF